MRKREKRGDGECVSVCIELMEGGVYVFSQIVPLPKSLVYPSLNESSNCMQEK